MNLSNLVTISDVAAIERVLMTRHKAHLRRGERIKVQHMRDQELETLTMDVVHGPEVFRFEAQLHLEDVREPGLSGDILMDFLDAVIDEWFDGGREAYPTLDFSPYEFAGITVGLRGGPMRPDLEAAADALLSTEPELNPSDPNVQ